MIDLRLTNGVYELELCHKPLNEIGTQFLSAFEKALLEIDATKAKALILYSSLEGGFSAGADLRELYRELLSRPNHEHRSGMSEFLNRAHGVMNRFDTLSIPVIGVIHGVCFGGGFELALTCDVLVAESSARFCFPELRLGIIPGFGGIPRLKREMPNAMVRDFLLTGRSMNAKRAYELGWVSQLVRDKEGLNVARTMAAQMTKFSPDAQQIAKRFIKPIPAEELLKEKEHFLDLFSRDDVREALKKFVESDDVRPYLP